MSNPRVANSSRSPVRFLVPGAGALLLAATVSAAPLTAQSGEAVTEASAPAPSEKYETRRVRILTAADYARAEALLSWNTEKLVVGDAVEPEWLNQGDRFWYRRTAADGHRFMLVDPDRNTRAPFFDHDRMAAAMTLAGDTAFVGSKLPFDELEFVDDDDPSVIHFRHHERRYECHVREYRCTVGDTLPSEVPFVESPDGQWEAFVVEHDLYIRSTETGDTVRLTEDGEEFYSYGLDHPRPNVVKNERPRRPEVVWSPDSRKVVVGREDERGVEHMHYISYTPQRPEHYSYPYALPGDTVVPLPTFHIIDVESKENIQVMLEPRPNRLTLDGSAVDSTWSSDSRRVYVSWLTRASRSAHLAEVDAATGEYRIVAQDSGKTFVETSQRDPTSWYVSEDGQDVFWWSERDGWAHIWRFGPDGELKNQVTKGPWAVGAIRHVDEGQRRIYFTAYGREEGEIPYYGRLYSVGYDGSGLRLVAGEAGKHEVEFSPSGRYFVDAYSRIDQAPTSLLRRRGDGESIRTLEDADVSRLRESGWAPLEVFKVKARDGVTDIYGIIYLPPGYDPEKSYPVVDHIYPGPQVGSVGSWSFKHGGEDFGLAQLGFIVVELDHLGTPQRSKAFHDNYYGNFIDNGIPDHIAALKQLAARYPGMDLDRVGIYGHSGGAFASTDAILRFPDFFKVAVSSSGNHDNRSYNIYWAEKYQGLLEKDSTGTDNFESAANPTYAENLEGRLLLMHGDMDDNVHPAMTVQVIDALTDANKDYDLLWAPDRPHSLNEPYFIRRRWDYFVEHLMGAEPPREYEIVEPEGN